MVKRSYCCFLLAKIRQISKTKDFSTFLLLFFLSHRLINWTQQREKHKKGGYRYFSYRLAATISFTITNYTTYKNNY